MLTKKTIRADKRINFMLDWSHVVDRASYRLRSRSKRSTSSSRILFIYKHSLQLERMQPNSKYSSVY